ncbi:carboxypeptidase regulatory-like domain-containing protein [Pseudomonadota bacterium]
MFNHEIKLILFVVVANLCISPISVGANLELAQSPSAFSDPEKKSKLVNLWRPGDVGQRMYIRGRVTGLDGKPIAGASISIRQADGTGEYQDRYQTTITSDEKGGYRFASVLPGQYYGVKHVHLWVTRDGYEPLNTEIVFKGDPNLDEATNPQAVFLEEGKIKGETILFGRFDMVMQPM